MNNDASPGHGPTQVLRDARLCLLASRDEAEEFLAWSQDELGPGNTDNWDDVRVAAVIRFLGGIDDLQQLFGCTVLASAGEYFAVLVEVGQLLSGPSRRANRLIDHPALLEASIGRLGRPGSNTGTSSSALVSPRDAAAVPSQQSCTGKGVLVGVVDTVFDVGHPAFLDARGESRVRWIWDVNAAQSSTSVPAGRLYTGDELRPPGIQIEQWETRAEATIDPELNWVWRRHGTIVSSIVGGYGAGGSFEGVAPKAELAFVGAGNETTGRVGDAADLLAGLHRLMREPGPVVANLSTADPLGPHDGTLLGERLLDELLLLPGRSVVVCAGNFGFARPAKGRGQGYRHDHAVVPACDGSAQFVLRFDDFLDLPTVAEIWIEAGPVPQVMIDGSVDYGGRASLSVQTAEAPVAVTVPPFPSHACGNVLAVLTPSESRQRWCLSVFFHPASPTRNRGPFFPSSTWTVTVNGAQGRVHAWLDRNNIERGGWYAPLPRDEWLASTVGAPATARRVITVGAVDAAGLALSSGTGVGPTLDGRLKPDLSARGEGLLAAVLRSNQSPWGDSGDGTSVATPLVAGTVALLFEAWGAHARHATWFDIRQALLRGAGLPDGAAGWDPALGAGTLNAGCVLAPAPPDVDLWIPRVSDDNGEEPLVREFICDSPAIVFSPASDGAVNVDVAVHNRGRRSASKVRVRLFVANVGASTLEFAAAGSPWTTEGIDTPEHMVDLQPNASASVRFVLRPGHKVMQLMAVADNSDDPLPRDAAPSSCNNMALRTFDPHFATSASRWTTLTLRGSGRGESVALRLLNGSGKLMLRGLSLAALPWREASIYERHGRQCRLLFGEQGHDPLTGYEKELTDEGTISMRTDIEGAGSLSISHQSVTIESVADTLWMPRLRLAAKTELRFEVAATDIAQSALIGLSVFSDGRRAGGALFTGASLAPIGAS
ncbi:S8 family serine peptidase [Methylovirgula sp. 4M-Z18]|uniref:S8 family serine peptidase n=1 Tax=Methylovirgula sp. 4M-Z18 TaxID=2293567 RepID=UPI000E2F09E2|nr:S8 family serine peptidase [Methylovirgula sp. 4M-Z18]RFB79773.1 hypothetical protein DYH55_09915 [Methylovirgula sp. 4M-Z18]